MPENETRIIDFEVTIDELANSSVISSGLLSIADPIERRKRLKTDLFNSLNGNVSEKTLDKICHKYQDLSKIDLNYPTEVKAYPYFRGDIQITSRRKI